MKVIRVHRYGGPEALTFEEVADPTPGPREAVVRVEAAGVNFIDVYHRTGLYKTVLPLALGTEGAGVVTAIGDSVTEVCVGERVAWTNAPGGYAEQANIPADRLVSLPEGVSTRLAAAVLLQGMTAHYLACDTYPLAADDVCVVHAAAGGVGLLLTQIAKRRGARVIATVSNSEKAALAREAGADEVVLYTETDFQAEVRRLTHGRGAQVVYDSVGLSTWEQSLRSLAPRGMLVLYGQSSGSVPPIDPHLLAQNGSLFLTRASLFHYIATRESLLARSGEVLRWVQDGSLRVRVGLELPLAEAAEAHRRLEARATTGKILLLP